MYVTPVVRIAAGSMLALAAFAAAAQSRPPTTEQLGKDPGALRQEAEQQRSRDMQQQQQQSQQQADQQWNDTVRQQQSRANADMAQAAAVRRTWEQRPPLAPDHNPLLGRWNSLGAGQRQGNAAGLSPEMAQLANALIGSVTGGMCDSMLGRGTIEFRPNGVVAIGADGRERPMYRAEYRGGGSRVVVLPQGGTTFTHMIIDFNGSDRATVAAVGCGLTRAGAGTAKAALTNTAMAAADSGPAVVQWKLLGHTVANGGFDVYVAPASVRRSGDKARMLGLFDFDKRQTIEGKAFFSARNEYEYDCARPRQRMLATTGYSEKMGKGVVVERADTPLPWEPVGSSGPAFEHWQVACKRQ
jgi:hypothetical protein